MLGLNSLKKINSIKTKKGRNAQKLFLIEGKRSVQEYLLKSDLINEIIVSELRIKNYNSILDLCDKENIKVSVVPESISRKLSDTKTSSGLIATCKINFLKQKQFDSKRWLFLHKVKDPGNLGTLLRSAAWFNIKNIALSKDCTDPYNNKVVPFSNGSSYICKYSSGSTIDEFVKNNYLIIGADQNGNSTIEQIDLSRKIYYVLERNLRVLIVQHIKKLINLFL